MDYIRSKINFVNYVYERKNADIHIMITTQPTGGGGTEYTLTFIGKNRFSGKNDTLVFNTQQDDTDEIIRQKMVRTLKLGLIPYISKTPIAKNISISYNIPGGTMVKKDRWNNWVFSTRLSGFFNGQKSTSSESIYSSISANRITEDWKIRLSIHGHYRKNIFKYEDETIRSISTSKGFYGLAVKSLTNHWSIGMAAEINASTFNNIKISYQLNPGIEFNLFPYSQSTRRELRFLYNLGSEYTFYDEETIYYKMKEALVQQQLEIAFELKQPWGTIETNISGSHYLHDFKKNHLNLFGSISLRLFKGLSLRLTGSASKIHDQLSLPLRGATKEEVLLQRRELETQYSYFTSVGFEYTFGSIFNNIVNPRFGTSSGGRIIIRF